MDSAPEPKKEEHRDMDSSSRKIIHTYPLIRHADLSDEMKSECVEIIVAACEKFPTNHEAAAKQVKETLDKRCGPSWHCVVGETFALEISHETKNLIYMFLNSNLGICAWKCS